RKLTTLDAAEYRRIRLESLERHPEAYGSDFAAEQARALSWFAERLETSAMFGAFAPDLVGIAGLAIGEGPKRCHKGLLWGVYVRASSRGQRLARRLCVAVLAEAADKNLEIVQLMVTSANAPARHLYEALGFTTYGFE